MRKRKPRFLRSDEDAKAKALGISYQTLWRYRTGRRPMPTEIAKKLERLDRKTAGKSSAAEMNAALLDAVSAHEATAKALYRLAVVLKERKKTEG